MGEYVFDQGWADASERAGIAYYPKLQCAVPFTPAAGPRLIANTAEAKTALINAMLGVCEQADMSGVHVTFLEENDAGIFSENVFLIRKDRQFHFINRGYKNFDDFLERSPPANAKR